MKLSSEIIFEPLEVFEVFLSGTDIVPDFVQEVFGLRVVHVSASGRQLAVGMDYYDNYSGQEMIVHLFWREKDGKDGISLSRIRKPYV